MIKIKKTHMPLNRNWLQYWKKRMSHHNINLDAENLITETYTERCKEMYKTNVNIIGMVCQEYLGPEFIHIVPGISKHVETDNKGQKYNTIIDKKFADFFVVGRSISKFF